MDSNSNSCEIWPKLEIDADNDVSIRRLNWSSAATIKLIEAYEKECRELWDVKNPLYRDRIARTAKLEYLASKFATTADEISRKLHNLRSQFNTELRKIKKKHNGEGLQGASGWDYFDLFLFLVQEPSTDPLEGSIAIETVNIELAEFQAEEELEFGKAARAWQSSSPSKTYKPAVRVAASAPPPLPPSAHPLFWPDEPQPKIRPGINADECQIFGDFVASELRTLRSDESRKRLKRIIQKAILKIGEEEDVNIISG